MSLSPILRWLNSGTAVVERRELGIENRNAHSFQNVTIV